MSDKSTGEIRIKIGKLDGKLNVLIDGKKTAVLSRGEEQSFKASSGRHTVQVESSGFGVFDSEPVDVELTPNSPLTLECGLTPLYKRHIMIGVVVMTTVWLPASLRRFDCDLRVYFAITAVLVAILSWALCKGKKYYYLKKAGD